MQYYGIICGHRTDLHIDVRQYSKPPPARPSAWLYIAEDKSDNKHFFAAAPDH